MSDQQVGRCGQVRRAGGVRWLAWALLGLAFGCPSDDGAPGGGGGTDGGDVAGGSEAPTETEARAKVVFETTGVDMTDVGLGEERVYTVGVRYEGEGERLPLVAVVSSCGCLAGTFIEGPTEDGALVEVRVTGDELEDIDGTLTVEGPGGAELAEHMVHIKVTSRVFVQPRHTTLTADDRRLELTIGFATPRGDDHPEVEPVLTLGEPPDVPPLGMLDWRSPEPRLELHLFLRAETLVYELPASAFEAAGNVTLTVKVEEPEVLEFPVTVRWNEGGIPD